MKETDLLAAVLITAIVNSRHDKEIMMSDEAQKALDDARKTLEPYARRSRPYTDVVRPPIDLSLTARETSVRPHDDNARPEQLLLPRQEQLLQSLSQQLDRPESGAALRTTAQCIFDLRFHDLIDLCTRSIAKNADQLKVEPYDLATGLSGWAIETLAGKERP